MSSTLRNAERKRDKKALSEFTNEQLIDELRRRRGITNDFKLTWIHKGAFYNQGGKSVEEVAKAVSEEAEQEAKQKDLKEKLKADN